MAVLAEKMIKKMVVDATQNMLCELIEQPLTPEVLESRHNTFTKLKGIISDMESFSTCAQLKSMTVFEAQKEMQRLVEKLLTMLFNIIKKRV